MQSLIIRTARLSDAHSTRYAADMTPSGKTNIIAKMVSGNVSHPAIFESRPYANEILLSGAFGQPFGAEHLQIIYVDIVIGKITNIVYGIPFGITRSCQPSP